MSRYLILLPGDEDAWAALSPDERAQGYAAHERFGADLEAGGHRIVAAAELTHSRETTLLRAAADGSIAVTDGPFAESVEQLTGFYLIETDDRDGLVEVCRALAAAGETIEIRAAAVQEID
jgi:hypothetical protein